MKLSKNKYRQTGRFLELVILTLLSEEDLYGYNMIDKMENFGFKEDIPSLSTLYRRLNKMEKEGMVSFKWLDSSEGPKQKIYQITDIGILELDNWIDLIKNRRRKIDLIIKKYEENK